MINPQVLDCLKHYDEYGCGIEHIPPKEAQLLIRRLVAPAASGAPPITSGAVGSQH